VLGGIGITWEHDAQLLLRRAIAVAAAGDPGRSALDVCSREAAGARLSIAVDLPPEAVAIRERVRTDAERLAALASARQRAELIATGYVMPHWPKPWGREASAVEQLVIDEEFTRAGVERPPFSITWWILLTLIQHGTEEQINRWVEPTLAGELVWCQLFSEPNAGSDAAAIRTRAEKVDGGWLVNGSKIWSSDAHRSQRGFATVRTDPEASKHAGITAVAIDMAAPGVEVRPLRQLTGESGFNEVFFTDVFVPDEDVVGTINGGWAVARATLGNERVSIGRGVSEWGTDVDVLELRATHSAGDRTLDRRIGQFLAVEHVLAVLNLRAAERAVAGQPPGPEGNVTKLVLSEHGHERAALAGALSGSEAVFADGSHAATARWMLAHRGHSIAGGTSEITRNQIGERILGLPRDPLVR
jgi:alkylation response protein AidB-like acyl-CoA dehydrogenase